MNAHHFLSTLDKAGFQMFNTLLSILWQSSILLAAAAILTFALRRRSPALRHAIWIMAVLAIPLLPLAGWLAPKVGTPQAELRVMPSYSAAPQNILAPEPNVLPVAEPIVAANAPTPDRHPWTLLLIGYASGVAALLFLVSLGRIRLRRCLREAKPIADARTCDLLDKIRTELGIKRTVTALETDRLRVPITLGFLRPVVLLPRGLMPNLSDRELEAVLIHELSHIRRNDPFTLSLLSYVRAFLFFHPLVWLACRRISVLAESACDDAVLEAGGEPASYARMLTRLAESLPRRAVTAELAAGIILSRSAFLQRVKSILSYPNERRAKLTRLALGLIVVAGVVSLSIAVAVPLKQEPAAAKAKEPALASQEVSLAGAWTGLAVDKRPGSSRDPIAIYLKELPGGELVGLATGAFAGGRYEPLLELRAEGNSLEFDVHHRTGVRMHVALALQGGRLRGDAIPVDAKEESRSIELERARSRPRHFVRVVVGKDSITFQGQKTTWEQLPALLEKVLQDPVHTVLELARESDDVTLARLNEARSRASDLAWRFSFEYLSGIGVQPLNSKGSPSQQISDEQSLESFKVRRFLMLTVGKKAITFEGVKTTWDDLPTLLEKVPDREHTVLALGAESPDIPLGEYMDAQGRAAGLASQFGFEYLSFVGIHPLGSKGDPPQLLPAKEAGEKPGQPGAADQSPAHPITLDLDHHRMSEIAGNLRRKYRVRVCIEDLDYDMKTDTIRLGEALAALEQAAATRELTPREKLQLALARQFVEKGEPRTAGFDVKTKRYTGKFEADTIDGFLDLITRDSEYAWKSRNGTYVVFPRGKSLLAFPVTIKASDIPLTEAVIRIIAQHPPGYDIGLATISIGQPDSRVEKARISSLNLKGVPALDALCRAMEAAGGDFYWDVAGYKGQRDIYVHPLSPRGTLGPGVEAEKGAPPQLVPGK